MQHDAIAVCHEQADVVAEVRGLHAVVRRTEHMCARCIVLASMNLALPDEIHVVVGVDATGSRAPDGSDAAGAA